MGAPEATNVVRVLTLSVIISGLVAVPVALLQRDFRQDKRTVADLTTAIVSPVTSIVCALAGMGAMSLAVGSLAGSAIGAVLFISFAPAGMRFGFDRDTARKLLAFGLPLAGSSIVVFAAGNVDKMVVGAIFGAKSLGIYLLAFNLANLPVSTFSTPMRSVAPAAFARLQHDRPRMNRAFLMSSSLLGAVALPACVLLAAAPGPLIQVLYGTKWQAAATILPWLGALAALRIFFELVYDFFVVLANTRAVFTIQVVWLITLAPSIWLGAHLWGLPGTGAAQLAAGLFVVLPMYLWELRRDGIRPRSLAGSLAVPFGAGILVAGVTVLLQLLIKNDWAVLVSVGLVGVAAMAGLLYRMRHTLGTLRSGTPEPARVRSEP
jgi:PST family polysaccharide transporter